MMSETRDDYNRRWEKWFDQLTAEQKNQWQEALSKLADSPDNEKFAAELLELERLWEAPAEPEDLIAAVEEYIIDDWYPETSLIADLDLSE